MSIESVIITISPSHPLPPSSSFAFSLSPASGCFPMSGDIGGGGGLVAQSWPTLVTPWTAAHQAPLSMGFPRHKN